MPSVETAKHEYINVTRNISVRVIERFTNFMLHFMVTIFKMFYLADPTDGICGFYCLLFLLTISKTNKRNVSRGNYL